MTATYKLVKMIHGIMHYARVTVTTHCSTSNPGVIVEESAFIGNGSPSTPPPGDEFLLAVEAGVQPALERLALNGV